MLFMRSRKISTYAERSLANAIPKDGQERCDLEAKKGCASMPANLRRIALMEGLEAQTLRDDFAQVGVT